MPELNNTRPIDPDDPANAAWLSKLQGNILSGHGRDHAVLVFLRLPAANDRARRLLGELAELATSAQQQQIERNRLRLSDIPGGLFGNLFISSEGYRRLGFTEAELAAAFPEPPPTPIDIGVKSNFLSGMTSHAVEDFADPHPAHWEPGYAGGGIHAMLLLAHDDPEALSQGAAEARAKIASTGGEVQAEERGAALRDEAGRGIEHFGFADGCSQPLFLTKDFQNLLGDGSFGPDTRETAGGAIGAWNPFEPLSRVLIRDRLAGQADAFGSYFVFRKLEQNVRDFLRAEQDLADTLRFDVAERNRAGAMIIGRFRDGTPLMLQPADGLVPARTNNFHFAMDADGLKCPFHAHIRKANTRGYLGAQFERPRRITRRGMSYGERNPDDPPAEGVGLLFMCFQSSIRSHFAVMQKLWLNAESFLRGGVGIDPLVGQAPENRDPIAHIWPVGPNRQPADARFFFGNFVTMKGGEFFFAPSIPFLRGLA